MAVAASPRLADGIQPGIGPVEGREGNIDAGLDERGRDQPAGPPLVQPEADFGQGLAAVTGAHQGGEVAGAVELAEGGKNGPGMAAVVDDAQHTLMATEAVG